MRPAKQTAQWDKILEDREDMKRRVKTCSRKIEREPESRVVAVEALAAALEAMIVG